MVYKFKTFKLHSFLAILLLIALISCFNPTTSLLFSSPNPDGFFKYEFIIDDEGFTLVRINYVSDVEKGSSWVMVPRFSKWLNYTLHGRIYNWTLSDPESYVGSQYYFYKVLEFHFTSMEKRFEMVIEYNFSTAAMIIEPNGIFYSPQIGFKRGSMFEAAVMFPSTFKVNLNEALVLGTIGSYGPERDLSNSSFVIFRNIPQSENLLRIEIGFRVNRKPNVTDLENGVFRFSTVKRYEGYALKILNLYNATYSRLVDLFNVSLSPSSSLGKITVKFFLPDFYSLMSIGGYVPFTGGSMGDIHINFVFTRYVEGYIEVIALHELVHHFMWKAGISPQNLLWFHEGMAQYVSLELAEEIGYEGATMIRREIESNIRNLKAAIGENFGFLKDWTPSSTPRDLNTLYTAAYYVVSRLAEEYGGLEYYAKFFRLLSGKTVEDNAALCYYLSLAANDSVTGKLNGWGFKIPDIYTYMPLMREIEKAISAIDPYNPFLQPFKRLTEAFYEGALSGKGIIAGKMQLYLLFILILARFTPLIALLVYSSILFAAIIVVLKVKNVF
jgi:hypothetical protein